MDTPIDERHLRDQEDAELVAQYRAGDRQALATLFARHQPALVRFCRLRVHSANLAEDFAQETFLRACASLESLAHPDRFYPWLTKIARNLVVDHHRRNGRLLPVRQIDLGEAPPAEEIWLERSDASAVHLALDRVSPRHRDILWMDASEELSYEAIAQRIGSPVSTVAPLLHRARAALKREYLAINKSDFGLGLLSLPAGIASAARRLRDRIMQGLSGLPDLSGLAVPMASFAIAVGGLLAPLAAGPHEPPRPVASWDTAAMPEALEQPPRLPGERTTGTDAQPTGDPTPQPTSEPPPPSHVVEGVAEVNIDNPSRSDWARERARRMPIYVEVGPWWFGADPGWRPDGSEELLPN